MIRSYIISLFNLPIEEEELVITENTVRSTFSGPSYKGIETMPKIAQIFPGYQVVDLFTFVVSPLVRFYGVSHVRMVPIKVSYHDKG